MPDLSYLRQIALSGVAVGCIYGLVGIGFSVIFNASGIVNFAQGAFVMVGGILTYVLLNSARLPLALAALLAVILTGAVGAAFELVVIRPLFRRRSPLFIMILATLALAVV